MMVARKRLMLGAGAAVLALLAGCVREPPGVVAPNVPSGRGNGGLNHPDISTTPGTPPDLLSNSPN